MCSNGSHYNGGRAIATGKWHRARAAKHQQYSTDSSGTSSDVSDTSLVLDTSVVSETSFGVSLATSSDFASATSSGLSLHAGVVGQISKNKRKLIGNVCSASLESGLQSGGYLKLFFKIPYDFGIVRQTPN